MSRQLLLAGSALALLLGGCATTAAGSFNPPGAEANPLVPDHFASAVTVSLGDSVSGELSEGDSRTSDDGLLDRYVLNLAAGTRAEVVMRSDVFDSYLIVGREGPDGFEEIARDDDGLWEGLNSRLRFTAAEAGLYEIRARGFAGMGAGAYELSFADRGPAPYVPPPGSLAPGAEVQGALADADAAVEDDDVARYDAYRFTARAGDRYEVTARSVAFDTVLEIGRDDGFVGWTQLGYDDDGLGEGLNSRLRFIAPEDGDYVIRLRSFRGEGRGDYTLALSDLGPLPPPQPIGVGESAEGALIEGDVEDDYGQVYDGYAFTAGAGDRLEVVARSQAFDTVLELGRRDGATGWMSLAYDDDGLGQGTDSRLRYTIVEPGDYEVRVRAYDGMSLGQYVLSLADRGPLPPPPPPGTITVGAAVDGAFTDTDGATVDEYIHDDYRFTAQRGQRLSITLRSADVDSLLRVGRLTADGFEEIASDDDGAGGLDSRVIFTPEASGEYIVRATSYNPGATGAYALSVRDLGPLPRPRRLRLGQDVSDALTERDALSEVESRYDAYAFRLDEGDRAEFIARSDDFDTMLIVARALDEGGHELIAYDDDGLGDGTNSRLIFTAPEDGAYELWVVPYDEAGLGAYTLESADIGPTPPPQRIAFGQSVRGELIATDGVTADGPNYDAYAFSGSAGQRIRVEMRSGDFDSFLLLGHHGPEGLYAIAEDDDGLGEGTDSRITFTLPEDGEYEVWASSFAVAESGAYELSLVDLGPAPAPGSVVVGSTVRGELTDSDPQDEFGSFYDAYRFTAAEGERVRITLTSNDFDAFLYVGRLTDGVFAGEWSDDDGLSDLNSLLEFTAPAAGDYVVRVRSYGPGATGAYVLTLEPME